jgi:hypothetical protein
MVGRFKGMRLRGEIRAKALAHLYLSACVPPRTHQTFLVPLFPESPAGTKVPSKNRTSHAWVGRKALRTSVVEDQ